MRNLFLISKEDFINLIKNPMWIFFVTVFPVLMVMILGYITGKAYGTNVSAYDYYGITFMLYAILSSGMTSANAFMELRIKKPNMRIVYAPGSERNIYISKIIASFLFQYMFHLADLLFLHMVFHVTLRNIGYVLILFAVTELFANTLGIMLCCIIKAESVTNQIQSIIVNIFAITGGVLFSLDGYGRTARMISYCSPVKWIVRATFQLIYDDSKSLFLPAVIIMLVCIAVMIAVCNLTFKKEDCIC